MWHAQVGTLNYMAPEAIQGGKSSSREVNPIKAGTLLRAHLADLLSTHSFHPLQANRHLEFRRSNDTSRAVCCSLVIVSQHLLSLQPAPQQAFNQNAGMHPLTWHSDSSKYCAGSWAGLQTYGAWAASCTRWCMATRPLQRCPSSRRCTPSRIPTTPLPSLHCLMRRSWTSCDAASLGTPARASPCRCLTCLSMAC